MKTEKSLPLREGKGQRLGLGTLPSNLGVWINTRWALKTGAGEFCLSRGWKVVTDTKGSAKVQVDGDR